MKLIKKYPNGDNIVIEVNDDIGNDLLNNYPEKFEKVTNEAEAPEPPKKRGRKPVKNENEGNNIENQD